MAWSLKKKKLEVKKGLPGVKDTGDSWLPGVRNTEELRIPRVPDPRDSWITGVLDTGDLQLPSVPDEIKLAWS